MDRSNLLAAAADVLGRDDYTFVGELDGGWSLEPPLPTDPTVTPQQRDDIITLAGELALPTVADYQVAIDAHVDAVAAERNYSSGVSCASYRDSTNPQWAAEAAAFIAWRDGLWVYVYAELTKVQDGQREQPSIGDFIGELPSITWPGA